VIIGAGTAGCVLVNRLSAEMIRLTTRRGSIELVARADRAVSTGTVFVPFAFVEAPVNVLTNSALDPFGKFPEFKYSAVRAERAETSNTSH
jgi:formate dehydrogenase major subunit